MKTKPGVQAWSNVSRDKILADLERLSKTVERPGNQMVPGVTVYAGRDVYPMLRRKFPKDNGLAKLSECSLLGRNQCLVLKNEGADSLAEKGMEASREVATLLELKMSELGSSGE